MLFMFNYLLLSKKEICKFKVTQKNPLAVTCEKVAQSPRSNSIAELKNATANIIFADFDPSSPDLIILKSLDFLLKDFFINMHQTGLYNRQLKLWKALSNISSVRVYKLYTGIFKKTGLNIFIVDLFLDPKSPCITLIINLAENEVIKEDEFKLYLDKVISSTNKTRLKGIFYFSSYIPQQLFLESLDFLTNANDSISRYESIISKTNDTRLNLIYFSPDGENYLFRHIYPEIIHSKAKEPA